MIFKPLITTTKVLACAALCATSMPALANPACLLSVQGCVLPVQDAVVAQPAPVYTAPVDVAPVMMAEEPKSLGILPILAGLAAVGLLAYLLLDDDEPDSP